MNWQPGRVICVLRYHHLSISFTLTGNNFSTLGSSLAIPKISPNDVFKHRIRCCEVKRHHLEGKQEDLQSVNRASLIFGHFNNRKKSRETRDLKLFLRDYVVCRKLSHYDGILFQNTHFDRGRTIHRYINTKF